MEVKHELSRVQKNTLKATLFGPTDAYRRASGVRRSSGNSDCSAAPIPLPIYRLGTGKFDLDPKDVLRVADPEIEAVKKSQDSLFAHGEDKLRDLQNALQKNDTASAIPCPQVTEIDQARYDRLYLVQYAESTLDKVPLIKTCGITSDTDDGDSSEESDYDLDEEDEKFLPQIRREGYKITETLFESVVNQLNKIKRKGVHDPSFQQAKESYPLSVLSEKELEYISHYWSAKNKSQGSFAWNPKLEIGTRLSSASKVPKANGIPTPPESPYTVFRPAATRYLYEPRLLRSQKLSVSFKKAKGLQKSTNYFKRALGECRDEVEALSTERKERSAGIRKRMESFETNYKQLKESTKTVELKTKTRSKTSSYIPIPSTMKTNRENLGIRRDYFRLSQDTLTYHSSPVKANDMSEVKTNTPEKGRNYDDDVLFLYEKPSSSTKIQLKVPTLKLLSSKASIASTQSVTITPYALRNKITQNISKGAPCTDTVSTVSSTNAVISYPPTKILKLELSRFDIAGLAAAFKKQCQSRKVEDRPENQNGNLKAELPKSPKWECLRSRVKSMPHLNCRKASSTSNSPRIRSPRVLRSRNRPATAGH